MRLILFALICCLAFFTISSSDAREEGIAAVVNEDAISMSDLYDRLKLVMASSGLPNTQEVRDTVSRQVISVLIEEQIKLQEARRLDIEVTPEDIDQGFASIAQQNNFSPAQFESILKKGGLNIETMRNQIKSQVAWSKVVQAKLRPQLSVTDNDIDALLDRLSSSKGLNEYLLAEIFLPVDDPKTESDTRQLAQELTSQIQTKKAPFIKLAQQFSKAAGAPQGGDMGWVQESHLPEELAGAVQSMSVDEVSAPIRSVSGYHILYLRDKRQISDETMPSRDDVGTRIGLERLERLQRRYLLDLKSSAFVENRVTS